MNPPIVILVGNKVDLVEERDVPDQCISTFCTENKFAFVTTSAKSGHNITSLLSLLGKQVYERHHHDFDDE